MKPVQLPHAPSLTPRGDEPTAVVPIADRARQSTVQGRPRARRTPPPAPSEPASHARLIRASDRSSDAGHYHVRDPEDGTTSITPPPPRSSDRPAADARAHEHKIEAEVAREHFK